MSPHPSYADLVGLSATGALSVPESLQDQNGHLNIRHYLGIASDGLDEALTEVGIPRDWPAVAQQAVFSAEHHLTYLDELHAGDEVSVRVRLVGRSSRAAHALIYLLDDSHERLSYVMEEMFLHVDMTARRTSPWPQDVADLLDQRVARDAALPFDSPVSGCLSLR